METNLNILTEPLSNAIYAHFNWSNLIYSQMRKQTNIKNNQSYKHWTWLLLLLSQFYFEIMGGVVWIIMTKLSWINQGQIQDFHLGGGGGAQKICASTHIMSTKPKVPLIPLGSRAWLRPWKVWGEGLMLPCAIWTLFFKHVDTKWD